MSNKEEALMDAFRKAERFRETYGYGPNSAYIHTEPVYGTIKPAVQVWFELDVTDFEKARQFLDLLAFAVAQGGDEGLVVATGVRQAAQG